jgi:diguanylate cyclase (GGDEF)-like protein
MKSQARFLSVIMPFIERQNKTYLFIGSIVLVAVLGTIDYLTGYQISFAVFYVVPISLVAYFVGRRSALLVSVLSTAVWFMADIGAGHEYLADWIPFWNAFTRLLFFALVALSLSALREAFEHEKELARSDFLTGAANSRSFFEVADNELGRARRYARPFSVAHIDVDNFKTINDTLGHHAGDDLLRAIVATIKGHLRETDLVARIGGDEFVVLLPETAKDEAIIAIQKLHRQLSAEVKQQQWPVSFSVGLLTCLDAPRSVDELLKLVDKLTYEAKHGGKNTIKQDVVAAKLVSVARE